jgi:arylsulfatase A-like enzyme
MKTLLTVLFCLYLPLLLTAEARPNILFIYTDDQSTRTVGCYEDAFDFVKTPNIDALAKTGVRFSRAYIGSWCMPSRATMLTGLHQHGVESMRMEGKYPGSAYDPKQCPFWPAVFRQHGYITAQIGKWHTGVDGGFGRDWDYQIIWNRPKYVENSPNYYHDQMTEFNGGQPKLVKGYTTDNYTQWAVDFIKGKGRPNKDKPWYLWLCYGAVHGPFTPADRHKGEHGGAKIPVPKDVYPPRQGKPKYVQKMEHWEPAGPKHVRPGLQITKGEPVEKKVRELGPVGMRDIPGKPLREWIKQYHEGVLAIDEGVGRVLKALKDSGQDENTLVVFTSDQGFAWGQHGFKSKVAPYHATVGAPLIIRPPQSKSKKTAGRVVTEPVSGVDLPPTFFAQAGLPLPWKMHGEDLSPLLENPQSKRTNPAMLVHTGKIYGSATAKIPLADDPKLYHGPGIPWYVMLAEGRYKYIRNLIKGEMEELYDLDRDPEELTNLALDPLHAKRLVTFRKKAITELHRTKAPFAANMPRPSTLKE